MYAIDLSPPGGLYRLNLVDATPTLVGNTGLNSWQSLASDPTDAGQLYGTRNSDVLYKLSRADGSATEVADLGFSGGLFVAGLEFDANGVLWASLSDFIEMEGFLATIDKTNGQVTIVGPLPAFIGGIDFDSNGTLYGLQRNSKLYIIDPDTAATTFVGESTAQLMTGLAFSLCGNGAIDANEQCDDGNPVPCDGCSAACVVEPGTCGDGVVDPVCEQCDDGNDANDDGCRNDCTVPACGDGIVDPGEACDDGNQVSGDGCSADCAVAVPAVSGIALIISVALVLSFSTLSLLARRR